MCSFALHAQNPSNDLLCETFCHWGLFCCQISSGLHYNTLSLPPPPRPSSCTPSISPPFSPPFSTPPSVGVQHPRGEGRTRSYHFPQPSPRDWVCSAARFQVGPERSPKPLPLGHLPPEEHWVPARSLQGPYTTPQERTGEGTGGLLSPFQPVNDVSW